MQLIPTFTTSLNVVQKRSGETVPFDAKKIFDAIKKAVAVTHEISDEQIATITQNALVKLEKISLAKPQLLKIFKNQP